jgi:branched-chain amino acid transport system permease protein
MSADLKPGRAPARRVLPAVEVVLLALALLVPLTVEDYLVALATKTLILALLALSFDLVWGYAGIMSFGQSVFFGVAGYVAAVLARDLGVTSGLLVLPLVGLVGALLALLLACLLILGRRPASMIFVALGTLTAAYATERLARGWGFVGGQNGIPSIPPLTLGGHDLMPGTQFYYLALVLLVVAYAACRWVVRSPFGLALAGLRESESRIAFFGYRVQHLKAIVFSLAGGVAGLGGGLYAFHEGFVWPNMLGVVLGTQAVLYVLLGGTGTLVGAVLGTAAIEALSFVLADRFQDSWPILLGTLLLVVVLFRPAGLVSLLAGERERVGRFDRNFRRSKEHDYPVGSTRTS